MSKLIKYNDQAREALFQGVEALADAVSATLGPTAHNVAIGYRLAPPKVIHDGVSIAKEIDLKDPFLNLGVQLVKEASLKTNEGAGDGTTTATVLAHAICEEGLKEISSGANAMKLRQGLEKGKSILLEEITNMAQPIETIEDAIRVATISAQDQEIGTVAGQTVMTVGKDGVVTVEEGATKQITVDLKEGYEYDRGFLHRAFLTNKEKMICEIDNPYILITDYPLVNDDDLMPFLELVSTESKDILIICDYLDGPSLATAIFHKGRGTLNIVATSAPGHAEQKEKYLEDIALTVGGKFFSKKLNHKLPSVTLQDIGHAQKVISYEDKTVIIGGKGDKKSIDSQIKALRSQIDEADEPFKKELLKSRLSKIAGKVAVIKVGAITDVEMKEKKERVIDAISATKAAVDEGIVPGGGVVLIRASKALNALKNGTEQDRGIQVLERALLKPFKKLIENAGLDLLENLRKIKECTENEGIDTTDGKIKDLLKEGIIDPVKVTKSALSNAISVAGAILTTNVLVVEEPEESKK